MASFTELMQTELGKDMLKSQEKANQIPMNKHTNQIGEEIFNSWNPYKLQEKFPFAVAISKAYDQMIENTIPKDAILSTRFQNWIIKEKNELMVDSKINRDSYFRQQTSFETGEVYRNYGANLVEAKIEYLEKELEKLGKSFKTHMENNPEIAFASKDELNKWQNYYNEKLKIIKESIELGNFSAYDKKDGENVVSIGTKEDAQKHEINMQSKIQQVDAAMAQLELREAKKELSEKVETQDIPDYTQRRKQ